MACRPCMEKRRQLAQAVRSGNIGQAAKVLSVGARMMLEKAAGVDIEKKYGHNGDAPVGADMNADHVRSKARQ